MIKPTLSSAVFIAAIASSPSYAITLTECRSLPSVQERQDCYVRRARSDLPVKQESGVVAKRAGPTKPDPVDALSRENDQVRAKVKGICRGC